MSLDYALLGFLNRRPRTGYELQKKIEKTINHFWTSTQSQIYRTLNRMEEDAMIVSKIQYQEDKPNKKIYSITGKGRAALITWLSSPIPIPSHRNPFLVQLFFSGSVDKETIKANLLHYKREMELRLDFLNSREIISMAESEGSDLEQVIYRALIGNGLFVLRGEIDWVDATLREIETFQEKEHE